MTKYLTTQDLMDIYNVSKGTVMNWKKQGMPFVKLGDHERAPLRFVIKDVEKWLKIK